MTTSGVTIGSRIRVSETVAARRDRSLAMPSPSRVPMAVVTTTEMKATWSETPRAASSASLPNSSGYHLRVNPRQMKFRFESLKLKMIRTTIGANRNA